MMHTGCSASTALPALALIAGCASSQPAGSEKVQIESVRSTSDTRLNQAQLQALVMGMADVFAAGIVQSTTQLELTATTPADRALIHATKYFAVNAAYSIAAGPSPEAALLDMLALAALTTISTERRVNDPASFFRIAEGQDFLEFIRGLEFEGSDSCGWARACRG